MPTIYTARWVIPISSDPIQNGAVVVEGSRIVGVGSLPDLSSQYASAAVENFGDAAIIPGLVNAHTHLELTAMRGYLENEESNFFAWLRKLTFARLEAMTPDDILVSATWGACEAAKAGITAVGDASWSGMQSMLAVKAVGLRGIIFQESFGPDPNLAKENFEKLKASIEILKGFQTGLVRVGVSPHAPYTVSGPQLELIADYSLTDSLPLMMHAAESAAEASFLRDGTGLFAEGLEKRNIEWHAPGLSTIQYLRQRGILNTQPLLAHCIRVSDEDIETMFESKAMIAHCPKSNSKLGHGRAPFARFLKRGLDVGLGSDSVASNNTCDILEEARFAALMARSDVMASADEVLKVATIGGARCLGLDAGELRVGKQADLAVVSLSGTHQLPVYDPAVSLVFASSGRDVLLTMVAGREVYRDGKAVNVDEDALRSRIKEIGAKLQASTIRR